MKTKRNLSGIYFRHKPLGAERWENWCFEDLPPEEQNEILDKYDNEALKRFVLKLADTINDIGNQFDIIS